MSSMFSANFDQRSLAAIAQMYQFSTFLEPEVASAMQKAGQLVQASAQENAMTVFDNPTSELSGSIQSISESPWEVTIGTNSPYGRRWELGFGPGGSAMADSLGRVYHEHEKPYMQPALDSNTQAVLVLIDDAIMATFVRIGGG